MAKGPIPQVNVMYTLEQAAPLLGYCVQHLRRLCKAGKVPHIRRGLRYLFTEEDIRNTFVRMPTIKK